MASTLLQTSVPYISNNNALCLRKPFTSFFSQTAIAVPNLHSANHCNITVRFSWCIFSLAFFLSCSDA